MKKQQCMRPGCRKPMCATYSAPQYPASFRGPLCDRHAGMLHDRMDILRDNARSAVLSCPACKPGKLCGNHAHQLQTLGALPPEEML